MQAVIFPQAETIAVERVPDPVCGPDEVVVRVASCGICGTDVHIYRGEYMSDFPVIPGHEFSGVVAEVGRDVTDFRAGDRVTVDPNLYCGHCDFAATSRPTIAAIGRGSASRSRAALPSTSPHRPAPATHCRRE
jgi:threonine dehydrogenase-like Zn-dependent dehydrogenase